MQNQTRSLRPFIGSKNFELSRKFYLEVGFDESIISDSLSYFSFGAVGFYLQQAFVKDWIDNTMLFLEVENLEEFWQTISNLNLPEKFESVRLVPMRSLEWGREFFLHDPSGILWHIGAFNKK